MISFFAKHPTAANLLMLIFLIMGLMSLSSLRRETFPRFESNYVQVQVAYPGASAEDVEEAICQRVEDAIDGLSYVEEVRSEARESLGIVRIEMQDSGDSKDFLNDIKAEVEAITDFPDEVEKPIIRELNLTDLVVSLAVVGPMSEPDLKAYCEDLKQRLKMEGAISQITIQGFPAHQLRIQVSAHTLMQYGLSLNDIAETVARQSLNLPGGTIETSEQDVLVRFDEERRTIQEFEDLIVISGQSGAEIRLGAIATIQDTFEHKEQRIYFNGKQAGMLQISKMRSEDSITVLNAVKAFLKKEEQMKPPQVEFHLTRDLASIAGDRLALLFKNGWQGLVLVFLAMLVFFNLKFSFWVAMGLPVSFLGAFFFFPQIDYSLNMMSSVALLIALGLLMDDAIVISENVASHLQKGKSALQAAIDGTSEVKVGVISSFITTICVFGPLAFIAGGIGKVLRAIPVVLIIVMSVSLVEAFWILPHHLAHSLKKYDPKKINRFRRGINALFEWIRERILGPLVDFAVSWRYLAFGLTIGILIISIAMLTTGRLKFLAFPDIDSDVIEARILLPQGTPLSRTSNVVDQITQALDVVNAEFSPLQPEGQSLVQNAFVQYSTNTDANESGAHLATVYVDLLNSELRQGRTDDMLNRWREATGPIPDAINVKFTDSAMGPAGLPIDIRLKGYDFDHLKQASLEIQQWYGTYDGVFDLSDDLRPGKPEVRLRLREGASALGLNAQTLASQLRTAYYGRKIREIQVGSEAYEIFFRLAKEDRSSLADLEYFSVTLADGTQAPIASVAILENYRGYARIARIDGQRTVTVQGNLDPAIANAAELSRTFRQELLPELNERYPDVRISLGGQSEETAKTGASFARAFLIGVIGIFILLSFQFRSYIEPLVVMVAIPFALIGVIWGHIVMGISLSMPSVMGFISLAGVVVNDSILLMEFIKLRRQEGQSVSDAARQASRERFRAVMLTSLTTIAGLAPLLSEKSLQAQVLIPIATTIVFGMMASTALVLLVIPALYTILSDFRLVREIEKVESAA